MKNKLSNLDEVKALSDEDLVDVVGGAVIIDHEMAPINTLGSLNKDQSDSTDTLDK